jgi:hypothetical protein
MPCDDMPTKYLVLAYLLIRAGLDKSYCSPIYSGNHEEETGLDSERIPGHLANLTLYIETIIPLPLSSQLSLSVYLSRPGTFPFIFLDSGQ